jgi:hypothetical protein
MPAGRTEEPAERDLTGRSVEVVFSDPWEFARSDGTTRFRATVTAFEAMAGGADRDGFLVRLDEALIVHDQDATWLLVRARRGPGLLQELSLGEAIPATFVAISADQAEEGASFDDEAWRGGLAAVGTVELR